MKRKMLSLSLTIILSLVLSGVAWPEPLLNRLDTAISGRSAQPSLIVAAANEPTGRGGTPGIVGPYNPAKQYAGSATSKGLFFKNPGSVYWQRVADDYLKRVKCPDAIDHLRRTGLWKGHLGQDGSCGPLDEPSDWAVGNRLNYEEMLSGEE
ncbi:MAG TPA: hypothetical protein VMM54_10945 [Nitrospirota bacterium]|nr:hypothetical protein [Nitrospirota bacterium]